MAGLLHHSCTITCCSPLAPHRHHRHQYRASHLTVRAETAQTTAINPGIKKEVNKVVDTVVVSELDKPLTAYCRCWRSGSFPLCDGSHMKHNKETSDNVGPLLVKK